MGEGEGEKTKSENLFSKYVSGRLSDSGRTPSDINSWNLQKTQR